MKNRFVYAVLLLSAMCLSVFAQEVSEAQEPVGPQPHEMLPSAVMDQELTVPEAPPMPEPPQPASASAQPDLRSFNEEGSYGETGNPEIMLEEEEIMPMEPEHEMVQTPSASAQPQIERSAEQAVFEEDLFEAPVAESKAEQTESMNVPIKQNEIKPKVEKNINVNLTLSIDDISGNASVKSINISE